MQELIAKDAEVKPVGVEFVETERDAQGRHLTLVQLMNIFDSYTSILSGTFASCVTASLQISMQKTFI